MDAQKSLLGTLTEPDASGPAAPVMTLPGAAIFPQEALPLFIFEPKYRRMLKDVLTSHRMFVIAMKQANGRPAEVGCLGLVRLCVENSNGTSHLLLQGVMRVELGRAVRTRPYRVHEIRALPMNDRSNEVIDALLARVRDLVGQRIELGIPQAFPGAAFDPKDKQNLLAYVKGLRDPHTLADVVSRFFISGPAERQTLLETVEAEPRLKCLIDFLTTEIRLRRKAKKI